MDPALRGSAAWSGAHIQNSPHQVARKARWMRQRSFRGGVRSRWKGAQCVPATTIGTVVLRPAMDTRRAAWDTGAANSPLARQRPSASDPGGPRPPPALRISRTGRSQNRDAGFIRCSPRTFPLEAAAVRLGQLESEERV